MSQKEIKRFIMFYERVTKNMSTDYKNNDFIIFLDKDTKLNRLNFK